MAKFILEKINEGVHACPKYVIFMSRHSLDFYILELAFENIDNI